MDCAIYIRVSTEGQRDNFSTKVQREKGEQFAREHGWTPLFYSDVESGKSNQRKDFTRLIQDIQAKKITNVWVIEFTRLSRNDEEESIFIRRLFQEFNVRLFDNGTEITFDSPEDHLFYSIRSSIAAYERRKITERMRNGMLKKYSQGGRRYPFSFGYDYVDKKTFINKDEAKVVQEIFERCSRGEPFRSIAYDLSLRGVKTKKGLTSWDTSKISKILRYTIYIGLIKAPDGTLIKSLHYEPIISKELWDKAQVRVRSNNVYTEKLKVRKGTFELSGLVTCKNCGAKYFRKANYKVVNGVRIEKGFYNHAFRNREAVKCREQLEYAAINERKLCDLVRAIYLEIFDDYDSIKVFYQDETERINRENTEILTSISEMQSNKKALALKKDKLIDLAMNGVFSMEEIRDKKDDIDKQIDEIEVGLARLNSVVQDSRSEIELLNDFSEKEIDEFFELSENQRKELYMKRVKYIVVNNHSLEIELINRQKFVIEDMYNLDKFWQGRVDMVRTYYEQLS